jgi:solute carrier family 25 (peroxisomal adenine nucleotide transporter), member 17
LKEEGVSGFFGGIESAMFGIAISQAVYYYFYETVKGKLEGPEKKTLTILENMLSGAIAGVLDGDVRLPLQQLLIQSGF